MRVPPWITEFRGTVALPGRIGILFLTGLLVLLAACGTIFVQQLAPPGTREAGYQTRHRFLFGHLIEENHEVSREIARLPPDRFQDIHGGGWNCWRFETADGRRFTAKDWDLEVALEGTIVLQRDKGSAIRSNTKDHAPRTLALDHIEALWPLPLRRGDEVILARRLAIEGAGMLVTDVYGVEHRWKAGAFILVPLETHPDYEAYGFGPKGEAVGLGTESIESFLRDPGKTVGAEGWASVPLSKITRWEFEKQWLPIVLLLFYGVEAPVNAITLDSSSPEPDRCMSD
jgi:hypothetical protein